MDFASFIVIGAIVSIIVQLLKTKFGTNSNATVSIVVLLSILVGSAYFFIKDTSLLEPIVSILGFAGAIYVFIIKRFE